MLNRKKHLLALAAAAVLVAAYAASTSAGRQERRKTEMNKVRLMTLDPGHFHAALVQKEMYPGVDPRVNVYAPLGFDLTEHLNRISRYNMRGEDPTRWELEIHTGADFYERMLREKPGNVVVISGRNQGKIDRIKGSVEAGLNVLVDKPWIIDAGDFQKLVSTLDTAEKKGLIASDIMTERYEITTVLQKELLHSPEVFGRLLAGSESQPAVYFESVHHILKLVSGSPNIRPAWFFDVRQQGEGVADVGTHLADLAMWMLFPGQPIDYRADIGVLSARRWATPLSLDQFRRVTGEAKFPAYLADNLRDGRLDYFCNGSMSYTLRGIHVKMDVIWNYEAPEGGGDSHVAVFRGSKSTIEIHQGSDEKYRPELYVVPNDPARGQEAVTALKARIDSLQGRYPGLGMTDLGRRIRITFPDKYRDGHEAHFAEVTRRFLAYLSDPASMPAWEKANMLAKYYTTTRGLELSYH